jgi:hypothetical protein
MHQAWSSICPTNQAFNAKLAGLAGPLCLAWDVSESEGMQWPWNAAIQAALLELVAHLM